MLAGGCLRGGQGPVQIIQLEPMRLRVLTGFGDALVHRRHLTAQAGDTVDGAAQRLLGLLDPQSQLGPPLRRVVDGEPRLVPHVARLRHLRVEIRQFRLEFGDLMQRLIPAGGQR